MIDPRTNLSHYPSLEKLFNSLDPSVKGSLTFNAIQEQLAWALNDYEQKRAIHRLHCVITSLSFGNIAHFQKLSADQKQALIVLTVLDGCKNSKESIDAYSKKGFAALKDGVPSLFDMLAKAPEIFPIHDRLSEEAKQEIKNNFFYLHLRHLLLGEVPVASVPKQALNRPRDLMVAFWYANAMGFNIEKPYPMGEKTGPTITDEQNDQFEKLLTAMETKNLTDYYSNGSIFNDRANLKKSFTEQEVEFICRLGKMLAFIGLKEDDKDYLIFVTNNSALIKELVSLESKTFIECNIEAFTFLPAVLKALRERIMPENQIGEILGAFLSLQKQLYLSTPCVIESLGNNRTIPLFGLSSAQDDMLKKFTNSSDKQQFHFEASMGNFIGINLVDGPVLKANITRQVNLGNK